MRKSFLRIWVLVALLALFNEGDVQACTNVIVTAGASEDGSAMLAYNADSGSLMGVLYHYEASKGMGEQSRKVYDWDSGRYLGEIPEADETYNVVGNCNEHGLCIGESTFGGVPVLGSQDAAIIDYGSLIYVTLQRSRNAREAIRAMEHLTETYGYASEGESFSIIDQTETWFMELIGRGNSYGRKGAVWVAMRVPEGMVSAHANQARIRTFPRDDPESCMYAEDVVDVAVHYGLYPTDADPLSFSFSDTYDPITYYGAREGEARVWSVFSQVADPDGSFQRQYSDYAKGHNLEHRMPLWIQPYKKVSLNDAMHIMTSHYEGTVLDPTLDIAAGIYDMPYRPRPVKWNYDADTYVSERTIAAAQTDWNFIAQIRPWMPRELSALLWFGVDDSSTSPRTPVYASSTRHSPAYSGKGPQDGVKQAVLKFDLGKACFVMNMVSNLAYSRWKDAYPVVRNKINRLQDDLAREVASIDEYALALVDSKGMEAAIEFVTKYGVEAGDYLHGEWFKFYGELFVRFRDFFDIVPNHEHEGCGCKVQETGLSTKWKERIVETTGQHYEVKDLPSFLGDGGASSIQVDLSEVKHSSLRSNHKVP